MTELLVVMKSMPPMLPRARKIAAAAKSGVTAKAMKKAPWMTAPMSMIRPLSGIESRLVESSAPVSPPTPAEAMSTPSAVGPPSKTCSAKTGSTSCTGNAKSGITRPVRISRRISGSPMANLKPSFISFMKRSCEPCETIPCRGSRSVVAIATT